MRTAGAEVRRPLRKSGDSEDFRGLCGNAEESPHGSLYLGRVELKGAWNQILTFASDLGRNSGFLSDHLDRFFQEGLKLLNHQDLLDALQEFFDKRLGMRKGKAELQYFDFAFKPQIANGVARIEVGNAARDDSPLPLAHDVVEGAPFRFLLKLDALFQESQPQLAAHHRDHNLAEGIFLEFRFGRLPPKLAYRNRSPAMIYTGRCSKETRNAVFFRKLQSGKGHLPGFVRSGRLQHGHISHFRIVTVILLVLT